MATYEDLMSAIIRKQISVIGADRALSLARPIPGVRIADDGTVLSGGSKDALAELARAYLSIASLVAKMLMKIAISPLMTGCNLELPLELR